MIAVEIQYMEANARPQDRVEVWVNVYDLLPVRDVTII